MDDFRGILICIYSVLPESSGPVHIEIHYPHLPVHLLSIFLCRQYCREHSSCWENVHSIPPMFFCDPCETCTCMLCESNFKVRLSTWDNNVRLKFWFTECISIKRYALIALTNHLHCIVKNGTHFSYIMCLWHHVNAVSSTLVTDDPRWKVVCNTFFIGIKGSNHSQGFYRLAR